ncbi:MAG: tRNA (adenosine(37)-N6)-threonylcarbamoyltransferase complex transferase subunit TsaD [Kiritimatiellae bacterium]|nr:tRNA (adenosine(37)-N6)-threonylcarbamoyltransferase complex transferase subunit TsaD [Kiritimatiellia bacterium]
MYILGIETSCDETAAAVVGDGREVVSNVVYTQIPLHQPYGGVVPEIASRAHIEKIGAVVGEAMRRFRESGAGRIDAVAVTYGPGLSPALIVGLNAAKGLAKGLGVPLVGINHIEAHLHTPFLVDPGDASAADVPSPAECMPALGLAISGGHTAWIDMPEYGSYAILGQTLDDAAGEAFDKAAKLLGLGYPGGPVVDRIAKEYLSAPAKELVPFPKGRPRDGVSALAGLPAELCVSFSGLKTALLRHVQREGGAEALAAAGEIPRVVASYQEAIVQAVADRTRAALARRRCRSLVVGGGVSLNSRLRAVLAGVAKEAGVRLLMAKPRYCGDNGAMIAGLAFFRRNHEADAMGLDVNPCLEVGE